ncbi:MULTISPECIES: methylamine utilization protein MauF [Paracoccus]|jgi:MFS family permease|uniref:methylamine utilization protein MauF n=1 Tax=Paracoccus TaxID=265 RepID=UPI00254EEA8B|nr:MULTISPECIES: methylamine utilization protein MauF [unclassified Paracoccus (in: a-proteobacteria)]MDK8871118.1 methylamine utilization protein MauF [Paracoccus sp. SSJ]
MVSVEDLHGLSAGQASVPDCELFPQSPSAATRIAVLLAAALAGAAGGVALASAAGPQPLWAVIGAAAVAGGLLSTWSPCGYSSISLLRPDGRGLRAVAGWLPTFAMHGAGYGLGALMLGGLLGGIGLIAGFSGFGSTALLVLGLVGLAYGAHQLDFLRVPYPQRRAQVPHDARQRFPKWVIGGLYGLSLGLDYLTYVQTPLLYMMTLAAVFTGNIAHAIAIVALFNLGRFLPVAVNALPIPDYRVQAWLARHQENAALADGAILTALGAGFTVLALI